MQLPQAFIDSISAYPLLAHLGEALLTEPEVSVRVNDAKLAGAFLSFEKFGVDPQQCQRVPWCAKGFYLPQRPSFTADPRLHQGLYYVQDASSMAVTAAIDAIMAADATLALKPLRYLDCCAAPGGKTTAATSQLPVESLIVANEYDFKRAQILAENMAKWGSPVAMATRGDTARLQRLPAFFDVVAVDAPCSGEGMMRKDEKAREQWSRGLVESCASLQRSILENAYATLRPGGWLIYSTCTFNRSENEENVRWLADTFGMQSVCIPSLDALEEVAGGIDTDLHCYRFIPGRTRGEGLFLALLRKTPGEAAQRCPMAKTPQDAQVPKEVRAWLRGKYAWRLIGSELYVWPAARAQEMATVVSALDAFMPGLHVATIKGKDCIPAHELALSTAINAEAFPHAEVTERQALAYLHRDAVSLPPDVPKGYVLIYYGSQPLGFVKNLGNRTNNLYPKNWRIRN